MLRFMAGEQRFRWVPLVMREDKEQLVRKSVGIEVAGWRPVGKLRISWEKELDDKNSGKRAQDQCVERTNFMSNPINGKLG